MSDRSGAPAPAGVDAFLDDLPLGGIRPPFVRSVGRVVSVESGVGRASGLDDAVFNEVVRFPGDRLGMVFGMDEEGVDVVLLDDYSGIGAGDRVERTGRGVSIPVGEELLGRTIDPLGRPLDGEASPAVDRWRPIENEAPGIMARSPVSVPLQTGITAIDALIPIGRGQRELIVGDRETGKTAVALATIGNQRDTDVVCIYCAVGKRKSAVARALRTLEEAGMGDRVIVVATTEDDPPGLNYAAPYAATAIGEFFRDQGRDALVVFDDLTRHARSYREMSLLLRRPPAREAYPGDIFYIHSRLLERATNLRDGGSLTALPIVETQAGNLAAYIPTNLVSITDGQILLSPQLFDQGVLPAIDIGGSVSRVGGKTQEKAYRSVSGDLRLAYSQFEELESFSRFGVRLEAETRAKLERGRRVREILKQDEFDPMTVPEQIAVLSAVTRGYFDRVPLSRVAEVKEAIRSAVGEELPTDLAGLLEPVFTDRGFEPEGF